MKAYKATYNGKCRNITFEIGKTYTLNGELIMCDQGFHFCEKQEDVYGYYPVKSEIKVMEIEVLGDVITSGNKSVTNKFKVLRFLEPSELTIVIECDSRGNITHLKDTNEYEFWKKYDEKDNMVYYKDIIGSEEWNEYDENNNLIYNKKTYLTGIYQEWWKFNKANKVIRFYSLATAITENKNGTRTGYENEYDERNNCIHSKNYNGYEEWSGYDERNNLIYFKQSTGEEAWSEYDENNNLVYSRTNGGYEYHKKYDQRNNLIHFKDKHGAEYWQEFDERNNLIHHKDSTGSECWSKYDDNKNQIYHKTKGHSETWTEYDEKNNVVKRKSIGPDLSLKSFSITIE